MIYSKTFCDFHVVVGRTETVLTYFAFGHRDACIKQERVYSSLEESININEFTIFLASKK